jgi:hypothetical protein
MFEGGKEASGLLVLVMRLRESVSRTCASMTILPLVISFYDGVVLAVLRSSIDSL